MEKEGAPNISTVTSEPDQERDEVYGDEKEEEEEEAGVLNTAAIFEAPLEVDEVPEIPSHLDEDEPHAIGQSISEVDVEYGKVAPEVRASFRPPPSSAPPSPISPAYEPAILSEDDDATTSSSSSSSSSDESSESEEEVESREEEEEEVGKPEEAEVTNISKGKMRKIFLRSRFRS
jgi:hypothetical protein